MCRQGVHLLRELHVLFIREPKIWFSERIKLNRPRWAIINIWVLMVLNAPQYFWENIHNSISYRATRKAIASWEKELLYYIAFFFFPPLNFSPIKVAIVRFWWIQNRLITGFVIVKRFWCYLNQWLVFGYGVNPISFPMPLTSFDVRRSFWIGFACKRFLTRNFFSIY